ncbi:hypothetical protein Ga0074812_113115 [Parafrankia irregularis]|uniref:Uncharacterized protein n=1 Tax=Parafrankia irregularis TaxID=795642 RepID=A0A0S4QPS0_9ACTN|nr:hypothetical protein Ga0074812_113115 [Parafrankia irregularis]
MVARPCYAERAQALTRGQGDLTAAGWALCAHCCTRMLCAALLCAALLYAGAAARGCQWLAGSRLVTPSRKIAMLCAKTASTGADR